MTFSVAIIGGGPAGLMAAEVLGEAGFSVTIYDRMPNPGRKFLMAGRGGLNLTHSEPIEKFVTRYSEKENWMAPYIYNFLPDELRKWCEELGQETFVGSSGRVFPKAMKAAPLLRAWLKRLDTYGVKYVGRHTWIGFENGELKFYDAMGKVISVKADATLLAMGGASWPRLGSDGSWVKILSDEGVKISPLRPTNCGFTVSWSEHFYSKFAGNPLKPVTITHNNIPVAGEVMITAKGIEGGAVYALSSKIRSAIEKHGSAELLIDLRPGVSLENLKKKLDVRRGSQSLSTYLKRTGLSQIAINLLREVIPSKQLSEARPEFLAAKIKALPIVLTGTSGLERAISTAGGIEQNDLNEEFMLKSKPGVFAAGEMLDWEAPTGGYLLQGCFSTAVAAANGIIKYLGK